MLKFLHVCAGIRHSSREEGERVRNRLNALGGIAAQTAHSFWSDRAKGYVLTLLQDRVGEVGRFAERCRAALAMVYGTMFPLNPAPEGLEALMHKFRSSEAIQDLVREQMVGGARVALAFVRVHHPQIDLEVVGKGLPPPPGDGRVEMDPHYAVALGPAENIIKLVETETNSILRQQRRE